MNTLLNIECELTYLFEKLGIKDNVDLLDKKQVDDSLKKVDIDIDTLDDRALSIYLTYDEELNKLLIDKGSEK